MTKKVYMSTEYKIITDTNNPLCGKSYEEVLEIIQQDPYLLHNVQTQTPELCLLAVQQNGNEIKSVKEQTSELCLEAVRRTGLSLFFVKHQTPEICIEAVKQNATALRYAKEQTLEICLVALSQRTDVLQSVDSQFYQELKIELLSEHKALFCSNGWKLFYYQGKYVAGCRGPWTAEEALEHWSEHHPNQDRATLFREAIVKHEKQLNKIT